MLRQITGWTCAVAVLAASAGVLCFPKLPAVHEAMAQVQVQVLAPSAGTAAADANADGAVDILDLQRLAAHADEHPNVPEKDAEDLPPAAPAAGIYVVHFAAVSTALVAYAAAPSAPAAPHAAPADAAPPTTRFHRYSLVPHGPPALRLA